MDFKPVQQESCAALSLQEWHERMAHQNMEQVKAVLQDARIQSVECKDTCKACIEGQHTGNPLLIVTERLLMQVSCWRFQVFSPNQG